MRNSVYSRILISFFACLFLLTCLNAESQAATSEEFNLAHTVFNSVTNEIDGKMATLAQYFAVRTNIVSQLEANKKDERKNVLGAFTDLQGAVTALGVHILNTMDGAQLKSALDGVNTSIENFIQTDIDVGIFQRQGNINTGTVVGYNQAFANLESAYSGLSEEDRRKANKAMFGSASNMEVDLSQTTLKRSVPEAGSIFVTRCVNPAGTCYGYYTDANKHKKTCAEKHGALPGVTGVVWWSCHSTTCTYSAQHWVKCRAPSWKCKEYFPPPQLMSGGGYGFITTYTRYHDHGRRCQKKVHNGFWNAGIPCVEKNGEYFTCEHSTCPHTHLGKGNSFYSQPPSGSPSENGGCDPNGNGNGNPGNGGNGNGNGNGNGAPTPSSGNGNGNNGNGNGNGNGAPAGNGGCDTPPPVTVKCARRENGNRVCKEPVSSEREHYVTCANGHEYWSCKSNHYARHRERTCSNVYKSGNACGEIWQRCDYDEPERIGSTVFSFMSPLCPTDKKGQQHCVTRR